MTVATLTRKEYEEITFSTSTPNMQRFDPEGSGYDYETAKQYGIEPDKSGHWPSRVPDTGLILKGRKHPTFTKTIAADKKLGYAISKGEDNRYYSTQMPSRQEYEKSIQPLQTAHGPGDEFLRSVKPEQPPQEQDPGISGAFDVWASPPAVLEPSFEPYGNRIAPTIEDIDAESDQNLNIADDLEIPIIHAEEISSVYTQNQQKYKRPNIYKRALFGLANKLVVQPIKNIYKNSTFAQLDVQMEALSDLRAYKEKHGFDRPSEDIPKVFEKAKARVDKRVQEKMPHLQMPPAETPLEKIVELETGISSFVAKLIIARRYMGAMGEKGATAEIAAFEAVNLSEGGQPGAGVLLASALGVAGKIPAATTTGKIAKAGAQGGVLASVTAMEGGTPEDIAVAFLLPGILTTLKQFPHLVQGKAFEAMIAKEVRNKGFTVKDSKAFAKSVRDAFEVRGGNMTPKQWGAKHGKPLNNIRNKYGKAVSDITQAITPETAIQKAAKMPSKAPVTAKVPIEGKTTLEAEIEAPAAKQAPSEAKGKVTIEDVTPEGFGPKATETERPILERLKGETLDQAIARNVGYQIDNGKVKLEETPDGWKATVIETEGPRIFRSVKKQQVLNQVYESLNPGYISPPQAQAEATKVEKAKMKGRPGFVDLTPLANAGEQIKTTSEKVGKLVTRFGGLEPEVRKVLIEYEEQVRELPKVIAEDAIEKFGDLTPEQEIALENHRENPKKYTLPEELRPHLDVLEKGIDEYGKRLEELGYPADWPQTYTKRLEAMLQKELAKAEPNTAKIDNIKTTLEEAKDLQYLHHYYQKTSTGRKIWATFRRRISKKPTGVLGRKIPTYEKAEELGLKRAPLAVSYAHMAHEIARAEMADNLIRAINENPNLSLPEDKAPDEWVRLDERVFPASVQHQAWIEEGKAKHKRTYRKYPVPIAEALEEITYSRGNESIERAYDKLNFALKIIGFYNPIVMVKNDAVQLWRAAGIKGFAPLVLPQIKYETGELGINPPKAIQIFAEKGAEYEKLRKGGLFNNVVNYTPAVTEITEQMLNHIRETSGEKAARIIGEHLNPANLIKNISKYNNMTTWNMDEIMRIACYEAVKDSPMLKGMTDFEKIEWANDALVNYGKMPKSTKRWVGKGMFVPTYRAGNFRYFWDEASKVYQGQWRHLAPIARTVAYKMFIKWGLPAIIAAAILYKTGEERDVKTEKGYRLVIHNPDTNVDTVYALSDPLLEGAKLTQRTLRHTLALNLAPIPSLIVRVSGGPRYKNNNDPFGEFFKLGTPLYRDILNWTDKDKTVPQKILTQLAIAFVYTRRGREEDKEKAITALAKTLSIWTDWKEQASDIKKMIYGRDYYLGPGGKFGRLFRQYNMEVDENRAEIDEEIDSLLNKGEELTAIKKMLESERYETLEGISGRLMSRKAPLYYYWETMSGKDRKGFIEWLRDNKHYTEKEFDGIKQALDESLKDMKLNVSPEELKQLQK